MGETDGGTQIPLEEYHNLLQKYTESRKDRLCASSSTLSLQPSQTTQTRALSLLADTYRGAVRGARSERSRSHLRRLVIVCEDYGAERAMLRSHVKTLNP